MIPDHEASDVQLDGPSCASAAGQSDLLYQLLLRDGRLAGVASCAAARSSPDFPYPKWQATVVELVPDEKTESFVVHSVHSGLAGDEIHRCNSAAATDSRTRLTKAQPGESSSRVMS